VTDYDLRPDPRPARSARARLLARTGLLTAALGVTVALLAQPIAARADYDDDYYKFCIDGIGQGVDYCCSPAGGTLSNGVCVDPASLETPPTLTRRNSPPIVLIPIGPR
jgi:hypothetical protein